MLHVLNVFLLVAEIHESVTGHFSAGIYTTGGLFKLFEAA